MERIVRKRQNGEAEDEAAVRKQIVDIRLDLLAMKTTECNLFVQRASLDVKIGQVQMNSAKMEECLQRKKDQQRQLQNLPGSSRKAKSDVANDRNTSLLNASVNISQTESRPKPEVFEHGKASTSRQFICKVDGCGRKFGLIGDLSAHLSSTHMNAKRQCNFDGCKRRTASRQELGRHWRTHTGEKPFKCDFKDCKRAFVINSALKEHYRIHTGEKPHSCTHCDRQFRTRSQLVNHEATHTKQKNFRCKVKGCGKFFKAARYVRVHKKRFHSAITQFTCVKCSKTFANQGVHKTHQRTCRVIQLD